MREKLGYGMALLVSSLIAKASLQFPLPSGNQQAREPQRNRVGGDVGSGGKCFCF